MARSDPAVPWLPASSEVRQTLEQVYQKLLKSEEQRQHELTFVKCSKGWKTNSKNDFFLFSLLYVVMAYNMFIHILLADIPTH